MERHLPLEQSKRREGSCEMLAKLTKAAIQAAKVYHQLPDAPANEGRSERSEEIES